jgi:hypothetical protein
MIEVKATWFGTIENARKFESRTEAKKCFIEQAAKAEATRVDLVVDGVVELSHTK